MKYIRAIQVRTSTFKALTFRPDHLDKQCKLRSICSLGIGLIRVYTVAIPTAHCFRTASNSRTGADCACSRYGTEIVCCFGILFFNFNGVLPRNETLNVFFFLHFSVTNKVGARVGRPQTSSSPPVIFIAGRPKAALLFWFFGDFRCGALLFMVIHVIYKYKNK